MAHKGRYLLRRWLSAFCALALLSIPLVDRGLAGTGLELSWQDRLVRHRAAQVNSSRVLVGRYIS